MKDDAELFDLLWTRQVYLRNIYWDAYQWIHRSGNQIVDQRGNVHNIGQSYEFRVGEHQWETTKPDGSIYTWTPHSLDDANLFDLLWTTGACLRQPEWRRDRYIKRVENQLVDSDDNRYSIGRWKFKTGCHNWRFWQPPEDANPHPHGTIQWAVVELRNGGVVKSQDGTLYRMVPDSCGIQFYHPHYKYWAPTWFRIEALADPCFDLAPEEEIPK